MKRRTQIAGLLASFLLCIAGVHASDFVRIVISDTGTEIEGITYRTSAEAMEALKRLDPKEVRFEPKPGTSYERVAGVLQAFQDSGIRARTGFIGNVER